MSCLSVYSGEGEKTQVFTELSIQNFKAWRKTGQIRLAPITVFFGANSAGKTSLLHFLLMLRQSSESRDRKQIFHPGDETTEVDLGTFHDLIYRHDKRRELAFSLSWMLPKDLHVHDVLSGASYSGDKMQFESSIRSSHEGTSLQVESLGYTLGDLEENGIGVDMSRQSKGKYRVTAIPSSLVRNKGRAWPLPDPIRFYGFPEEMLAYFQNAGFTSEFVLSLEQQLRRVKYLGPLRQKPKRTYTWSGEAPEGVGFDGRNTIAALLAGKDRKISPGFKLKSEPMLKVVARWMKQLGLLELFDAQPISKSAKQYEISVEAARGKVKTNLPDVGFGVSQVLPVVVESFYADPHSTIVIEQPELHLHPKTQAYMADLFVEAIHSREDGKDRCVQFIIESHSEHFVYRMQRLIAEEKVEPGDVAFYFCEPGPEGSTMKPLEIDLFGNVTNWPDNFFGNEMEDVAARLDAAARKAENLR